MTTLLRWSEPQQADRALLPSFTCTNPGRKRRRPNGGWEIDHPRPWELFVQSKIRACRPPCQPPHHALVGRDDEGIGGFVYWEELDGPAEVEVRVAAVATRFRGKGGGWADEMMRTLFDTLTLNAITADAQAVRVTTWIHEQNHPSQRLCRNYGFAHMGTFLATDPELQRWAAEILVAGADVVTP